MALNRNLSSDSRARIRRAAAHITRAVFINKDGMLLNDVPHNADSQIIGFTPDALQGLQLLIAHGYRIVLVSNLPGIALGYFDYTGVRRMQFALTELLKQAGIPLAGFFICPHAPARAGAATACGCRKPLPGLLQRAASKLELNLCRSWMVGDILDDVEAGHRAGCRSILLDAGHEALFPMSLLRIPDVRVDNLLEAAQAIVLREPPIARKARGVTGSVTGTVTEPPPVALPAAL